MLLDLYPRVHRRFTSLPILGPILDGYAVWLHTQGYSTDRVRQHCRTARRLTGVFQQRGIRSLQAVTRARLRACAPAHSQDDPDLAAVVRMFERYVKAETSWFPPRSLSRIEQRVAAYTTYLGDVRGFAPSTIAFHRGTVAEFLTHLHYEASPTGLTALTAHDIEAFIRVVSRSCLFPSTPETQGACRNDSRTVRQLQQHVTRCIDTERAGLMTTPVACVQPRLPPTREWRVPPIPGFPGNWRQHQCPDPGVAKFR